jgi:hypothetical protein
VPQQIPEHLHEAAAGPEPDEDAADPAVQLDDGSVGYALDGAVIWGAMAVSRALVNEDRDRGDVLLDRLLAVQRALIELRGDWRGG